MPYKKTGNPPGRPPKDPAKRLARAAKFKKNVAAADETPLLLRRTRARRAFRAMAERLLPSQAVQILDSRGRPRRKPSSQRRIA